MKKRDRRVLVTPLRPLTCQPVREVNMAADPVSDNVENVIAIKRGRGGKRPGAGRPPLSVEAKRFREVKRTRYCVYVIHEDGNPEVCKLSLIHI